MVLFSLYGVGTCHARLGRSKNPTFQPPSGWLAADEGGERTGDFSKPVALRGHDIAFGLTFTTLSGVRSTPGTTGARSAPPVTYEYQWYPVTYQGLYVSIHPCRHRCARLEPRERLFRPWWIRIEARAASRFLRMGLVHTWTEQRRTVPCSPQHELWHLCAPRMEMWRHRATVGPNSCSAQLRGHKEQVHADGRLLCFPYSCTRVAFGSARWRRALDRPQAPPFRHRRPTFTS
jgi:hypothetical protein